MEENILLGVLAIASLLPGLVGLLLNRRLDPQTDDSTLLARQISNRQTFLVIVWVVGFSILFAASRSPVLYLFFIPLVLGVCFAAWDNRRRLLGERWNFAAYSWFFLRLVLGMAGPSLLLLLVPPVVLAMPQPMIAGVVATVLLLLVFHNYHWIMPWIFGCKPWQPPETLTARLDEIDRLSGADSATGKAPRPRRLVIPVGAGLVYNAWAVPHSSRPAVLYTSALLDSFPESQIAGIYAHEISHLEQFRRPRVRRNLEVVSLLLTLATCLGVPYLANSAETGWLVLTLWSALVISLLLWRSRWIHGLETEADQRAVALLGGDGEALAQGLEELHRRQRTPRRLAPELEQRMTHPSLARRLQSIRRLSGRTTTRPTGDGSFPAPDGESALVFASDRLHRLSGLPPDADPARWAELARSSRSDAYEVLTELRFSRDRQGQPVISGAGLDGGSFTCPIREDDAARAEAWLDAVDGELAAAPRLPVSNPRTWRLLAILAVLLTMPFWDAWPIVALASVLVILSGTRAAAGALAAALGGTVALLVRDLETGPFFNTWTWTLLFVVVLGGSALLILLGLRSPERRQPAAKSAAWIAALYLILGFAATILVLAVSWTESGLNLFALSDTLAAFPATWLLWLAAAGSLWTLPKSAKKLAATAITVTATTVTAIVAVAMALLSLSSVRHLMAPDTLDARSIPELTQVTLHDAGRWSLRRHAGSEPDE